MSTKVLQTLLLSLILGLGMACGSDDDSDGDADGQQQPTGGNGSGDTNCASQDFCDGQTIEFCMPPDRSECWYRVDDQRIDCASCDNSGIGDCASEAIELCNQL